MVKSVVLSPKGRCVLFVAAGLLAVGSLLSILINPVVGVLCMLAFVASWYKSDWVLLFLIGVAPFVRSPSSQIVVAEDMAQIKSIVALILGLVWFVQKIIKRENLSVPYPVLVLLGCWFSLISITSLNAQDTHLVWSYLNVIFGGIAVWLVAFDNQEKLKGKIMVVIVLGATVVACICILQYFMAAYRILPSFWKFFFAPRELSYLQTSTIAPASYRVLGTFLHPNQAGVYFSIVIPVTFAFLGMKNLSRPLRFLVIAALLLMGAGLYFTNCRGALLAVGLSIGYLSFYRSFRPLMIVVGLALLTAGVFYRMDPSSFTTYVNRVARIKYGISSRNHVWVNAGEIIEQFPLVGVGPANFTTEYFSRFGFFVFDNLEELQLQAYLIQAFGDDLSRSNHAHNTYLHIFAEHGFFGVLLYIVALFMFLFYGVLRSRQLPVGSWERSFTLGTTAAGLGFVVVGCFDAHLLFTVYSMNLMAAPLIALGLKI